MDLVGFYVEEIFLALRFHLLCASVLLVFLITAPSFFLARDGTRDFSRSRARARAHRVHMYMHGLLYIRTLHFRIVASAGFGGIPVFYPPLPPPTNRGAWVSAGAV